MNRAQPRREHLLDVAYRLFNANGYHHTGIDTIMRESGVSKTTMYKYFRSKEELVLEVLKRRHSNVSETMDGYLGVSRKKHPKRRPHEHIVAIFEAAKNWMISAEFAGCNFINASAEYADADDPIHRYSAKHKQEIQKKIKTLLCELPAREAQTLSRKISLVLDGAIVTTQVTGDKTAIDSARSITQTLLDEAFQ